jgi:uncharacterized membrane protein YozB (DUF420 family)
MELGDFPALNATLNGISFGFQVAGLALIRRRRIAAHRNCMLAATAVSALFLCCYVWYHVHAEPRRFSGPEPVRTIYFTVLVSHIVLAVAVVPLVLVTLWRALRNQIDRHRRIARWTAPIWLYVSVTGVFVYVMLYQLFPAQP